MQFIPDRHVSESTVFVFDISIGVLCNLTIHGKPYMYFKYVNSIRSVMRFGLNYRRILLRVWKKSIALDQFMYTKNIVYNILTHTYSRSDSCRF